MSGLIGDALAQRMANRFMLDQQAVLESTVGPSNINSYHRF